MALLSLLDTFLAHLEVERGLSRHTIDAYRRDCGNFIRALAEGPSVSPASLTEKDVFEFLVHERRRGREVSSVRRSLSAVRTFLRFLVREKVLRSNPAKNLENPRLWKHLPVVLEVDQVRRLMTAVETHPSRYPLRDRAILELTYATGLRVSELCGLTVDSVLRDLGILRCLGKGSRERVVPVSRTSVEAVDTYAAVERPRLARGRDTDILFLTRGGRPLGREVVRSLLQRYSRAAGLPAGITPHTLRHSMATHLIRGGADLRVVQEILGHVNVETTEIYTHVDRSELKKAHKKYHPRG